MPAQVLTTDDVREPNERLEDRLALCLSGGGYRAMLFHLGTLWYLNDAGLLPELARISSVSGGSIAAAVLATRWTRLAFDDDGVATNFDALVAAPIRRVAGETIDSRGVITGILHPFASINQRVVKSFREHLYGDATLQDFPDEPRFVINATNVQTGSLFRFSKPYIADYRIGRILSPKIRVAAAVAASAAFPPLLSPAKLHAEHARWTDLRKDDCGHPPFTTDLVLTDGGVYDNLGLETVWKRYKRVLISDGGAKLRAEEEPRERWLRHSIRVTLTIDNQVRSLRKRQVIAAFRDQSDPHKGCYWGMESRPSDFSAAGLLIDEQLAAKLARTPTRLAKLSAATQNHIINFGYAMADRAVRTYYDPKAFAATELPCPDGAARATAQDRIE